MKKKLLIVAIFSLSLTLTSCFEQTADEKLEAKANDMKRSVKKAIHRVEEATCHEDDVECLKDKAMNRSEEGADYIEDKYDEAVDDVD
jgi:predicted Holliday junction resolvase-like endonuclease